MPSSLYLASMSSFGMAYTQSDFFGKLIILALVALSIVCWVVLVHKIWMVRKLQGLCLLFEKALQESSAPLLTLEVSSFPELAKLNLSHPYAMIFDSFKKKTVEILNKNHYFLSQDSRGSAVYLTASDLDLLQAHVFTTISGQIKYLEKNLFILSTIVTLAPFMGLLGTVWGILETFAGLQGGTSMTSNAAILGGISTALITTVLGLVIAIPALVSFNYLKNTLRHFSSDMDDFLSMLLSKIELQYRKVD